MLICPQCSAENPNRNNFCQKCGVSLTEHPCPHCGETVAYGVVTCPHCQGLIAPPLTVLISRQAPSLLGKEGQGQEKSTPFTAAEVNLYEQFIDIRQRYQLIPESGEAAPSALQNLTLAEQEIPVLVGQVADCQPLQPSVLKILLSQQTEFLRKLPQLSDDEILQNPAWLSLGLPAAVIPYFRFDDLVANLPQVYDAWCEGEHEVVLLEVGQGQSLTPLTTVLASSADLPEAELRFCINQFFQLWQR